VVGSPPLMDAPPLIMFWFAPQALVVAFWLPEVGPATELC
jgi:hypothetical protein